MFANTLNKFAVNAIIDSVLSSLNPIKIILTILTISISH